MLETTDCPKTIKAFKTDPDSLTWSSHWLQAAGQEERLQGSERSALDLAREVTMLEEKVARAAVHLTEVEVSQLVIIQTQLHYMTLPGERWMLVQEAHRIPTREFLEKSEMTLEILTNKNCCASGMIAQVRKLFCVEKSEGLGNVSRSHYMSYIASNHCVGCARDTGNRHEHAENKTLSLTHEISVVRIQMPD